MTGGSDLHLLDGYQPTMESGDILGHENMGEVIELRRLLALAIEYEQKLSPPASPK
jgi:hypothetical protein